MGRALSAVHLRLWRLKVRVLARLAPAPRPSLPPVRAAQQPPGQRAGRHAPHTVSEHLLARYVGSLEGLTLVQLGGDTPPALGVAPGSVDVIVCDGVLERLTPELVHDTLAACHRALRPGGSLIVRAKLCTSAAPSPAHARFNSPYPQLLVSERDLARLLRARYDTPLPYLNWLTASSYVLLFHQSGFETLDLRRIPADTQAAGRLGGQLSRALAEISPGELVDSIEAHLTRPLSAADLSRAGGMEDTRPLSVRARTVST